MKSQRIVYLYIAIIVIAMLLFLCGQTFYYISYLHDMAIISAIAMLILLDAIRTRNVYLECISIIIFASFLYMSLVEGNHGYLLDPASWGSGREFRIFYVITIVPLIIAIVSMICFTVFMMIHNRKENIVQYYNVVFKNNYLVKTAAAIKSIIVRLTISAFGILVIVKYRFTPLLLITIVGILIIDIKKGKININVNLASRYIMLSGLILTLYHVHYISIASKFKLYYESPMVFQNTRIPIAIFMLIVAIMEIATYFENETEMTC